MEIKDIEARLGNLILLTDEERGELRDAIKAAGVAADKELDGEGLEEARESELNDIMERMARGIDELDTFERYAAQFAARDRLTGKSKTEEPKTEEPAKDEVEATAEVDKPAESTEDKAPTEEKEEAPAMAASAATFEAPDDNKPLVASGTTPQGRITTTPRIGSDISGFTAGAEFRDLDEVNRAFVKRLDAIRGAHGDTENRSVVTLVAAIEEARQLDRDATGANMAKIEAVLGDQALVASGGYCAPLPVNYDIFGVGSAARPVRDSLPTFAATRGGIRFIVPPVLGAYTGAISLWTAANDANPTSPATKPVLTVGCAAEDTATADAVTLSLKFGNLMSRAFPELVQRHNQLALIQHARFAERTLLNKISAKSTAVTTSYGQGTTRDLLLALSKAMIHYRNRHRIPRPVQLRAIFPEWVRDSVREDIASNLRIENLQVTDAVMDGWFASRGVRITWHMDDTLPAQASGAMNNYPATIKFWLFAEGTFLFLDGGTLDLGVVRDSTLVGTNDYMTFVETFEGIAKVGIEALEVTATTRIGEPTPQMVDITP